MGSSAQKLYSYIRRKEMLKKGERVCVGLSGGADSVCLTVLLCELSERLDISVCAFHVNHCLRGAESDADETFVKELCSSLGIPLKISKIDVKELAKKNKLGVEEAGRIARRIEAKKALEEFSADKIALAHHMNDSAETMLFNLVRGTSLSGIKGIKAVSGKIIRPLIIFRREEIEAELNKRNIKWRTDTTNLKDDYTRNKIRLNIIPALTAQINIKCVEHMASAALDIEEADEIIRGLAQKKTELLTRADTGGILISEDISKEKRLLRAYVFAGALKKLSSNVTDIKRLHIEQIDALFKRQTGRKLCLPYGIEAKRTYEGVRLTRSKNGEKDESEESVGLRVPGITVFGDHCFETRLIEAPFDISEISKKIYTKCFDYDKLGFALELRYRRSGDYIVFDKNGNKKKLKRYFTDEKISEEKRNETICLAVGSRILWVVGGRISEDCKVDADTKRMLEINCHKNERRDTKCGTDQMHG